eukprot:11916238-Alexandrium_andersonii.AAC.1
MVPLTKLKAARFAGGRVPEQIFTKPNHGNIKLLLTHMTESVLYLASVEAGEPVVKSTRKGKGKGRGRTQVVDDGAPDPKKKPSRKRKLKDTEGGDDIATTAPPA